MINTVHTKILNNPQSLLEQTEEQQKLTEFGKYLLYFTNQFSLPTPANYSDRNPESDQAVYKTIYLRFNNITLSL